MSKQQREAVQGIIKECVEELEQNNYGLLALEIERRAQRYIDIHYPEGEHEQRQLQTPTKLRHG